MGCSNPPLSLSERQPATSPLFMAPSSFPPSHSALTPPQPPQPPQPLLAATVDCLGADQSIRVSAWLSLKLIRCAPLLYTLYFVRTFIDHLHRDRMRAEQNNHLVPVSFIKLLQPSLDPIGNSINKPSVQRPVYIRRRREEVKKTKQKKKEKEKGNRKETLPIPNAGPHCHH